MARHSINLNLDPALAERGVSVIFMLVEGKLTSNAESALATHWQDVQRDFKAAHTVPAILNHPHLTAYRQLHAELGISDSSLIPSPESSIRILMNTELLRSVEPIVDLYNAVALQHLISIGAHDPEKLGHSVNLVLNRAEIKFRPLGQKKKLVLPANEYSYQTDESRVICRLECKQANDTKLRPGMDSWFFILQGNQNIVPEMLVAASHSLTNLLAAHLQDHFFSTTMLDRNNLSSTLTLD